MHQPDTKHKGATLHRTFARAFVLACALLLGAQLLTATTGLASSTANAQQSTRDKWHMGHTHIDIPSVDIPDVNTSADDEDSHHASADDEDGHDASADDEDNHDASADDEDGDHHTWPVDIDEHGTSILNLPHIDHDKGDYHHKDNHPDLFISKTHLNGRKVFKTGQRVTFLVVVGNTPNADRVRVGNTVTVTDVLPEGLKDIKVNAPGWFVNVSCDKSPSIITATFNGGVQPGQLLPVIKISGKLTNDAVPSFTNTAKVDVKGDECLENNVATDTICVEKEKREHHHKHEHGKNHEHGHGHGHEHEHEHEHEHVSVSETTSVSAVTSAVALPLTGSDPMGHVLP